MAETTDLGNFARTTMEKKEELFPLSVLSFLDRVFLERVSPPKPV